MSFANPLPAGIRQVVPDYVSDGLNVAWSFPFRLWGVADVAVFVSTTAGASWTRLALGTQYSVTLNGVTSATVTLLAAQPAGALVRLMGLRTPQRTTSVVNDGVVQSAPLESELDVVEAVAQELRRDISFLQSGATLGQAMTAWLATLPGTPGLTGTWWSNDGIPTFVTGS